MRQRESGRGSSARWVRVPTMASMIKNSGQMSFEKNFHLKFVHSHSTNGWVEIESGTNCPCELNVCKAASSCSLINSFLKRGLQVYQPFVCT